MRTHNDTIINVDGTTFKGTLNNVRFSTLILAFGGPVFEGLDSKQDCEWQIKFRNGTVATIYNWKNGKNYNGESGLDLDDIREWNVGGSASDAVDLVKQAISDAEVLFTFIS